MYAIVLKHRFFCNGFAFNQLIGMEGTLSDATNRAEDFVNDNPEFKHHTIMVEEIFSDDISRVALNPVRKI